MPNQPVADNHLKGRVVAAESGIVYHHHVERSASAGVSQSGQAGRADISSGIGSLMPRKSPTVRAARAFFRSFWVVPCRLEEVCTFG